VLFVDGGSLVATGKSGAFFATVPSADCRLTQPVVVGLRRSLWNLDVAASTSDGVVVGDGLGRLWLTHVR